MLNQACEKIEEAMRELGEFPDDLLPVTGVFGKIFYRDIGNDKVIIHFDVSCDDVRVVPNPLWISIKTPRGEVLSRKVNLYGFYQKDEYPNRLMKRTESITLTTTQFGQIENNPDVEVTFSAGGKKAVFTVCF
jgi:hypothetical protein